MRELLDRGVSEPLLDHGEELLWLLDEVESYLAALDGLESTFGVSVPRELRREVARALDA